MLLQYFLGRLTRPVGCNWLSAININQFCVTFSIPNSIGRRCTGDSGYVAKAGNLNH